MIIRRLVLMLAAVLLAACATGGKERDARPDWVDGSSEQYPSSTYLVGIGSADRLSTARDRARADLAKTFSVTVDETASDVQAYSRQESAAGSSSDYSADIQRDLSLRTRQVLEGVTVPESWQDPETGRHHALAVLNRVRAAARLREEINGLDTATATLLERARAADDHFARAALAIDAVETQRRRSALQDMLRGVDPGGRGVSPRWPLASLEADLQQALSRITLQASGEAEWRGLLAGQLADSGFQVSPDGDYTVRLDVDRDTSRRDGWHWVRGVAVLDVTAPDGSSLGQVRWTFKESATDAATARMRFHEAVAARLANEGRDAILKIVRN